MEQKGRGWIDQCINILAGDLNCDPFRTEDARSLDAWKAVATKLDTGFAFSECDTFQGPCHRSSIDTFCVPELVDRHHFIRWKVKRHGPLRMGRHSPVVLDGVIGSKRKPPRPGAQAACP